MFRLIQSTRLKSFDCIVYGRAFHPLSFSLLYRHSTISSRGDAAAGQTPNFF